MQVFSGSRARSGEVPVLRRLPRLWVIVLLSLGSWLLVATVFWATASTWQALLTRL